MQLIDENENTVNTYEYDVFGTVTASSGSAENDLKFTGKRFDAESGLYYYNTRYYDALTGRFISKDKLYYELLMNNELNRLFLNIQSVMPLAEEQMPMNQIIDLKNYVETPQRLQPIIGQDDGIVYYMYRMFARLAGVLKSIGFDIKYFDMDSIDKFRNPQELNYYVYALNNPANLIDVMGGCGGHGRGTTTYTHNANTTHSTSAGPNSSLTNPKDGDTREITYEHVTATTTYADGHVETDTDATQYVTQTYNASTQTWE